MDAMDRALLSLDGLSVGDAFGAALGEGHSSDGSTMRVEKRLLPPGPWPWTDDTHMALSIVDVLDEFGQIEQDELADLFAERFSEDPFRGYGMGAFRLLTAVSGGADWRLLGPRLFPGGSYGNGAAMRAAPIGGYFAGDLARAAREGQKASAITHAHPEGQAGGMAVAVAAALAASESRLEGSDFLGAVLAHVPDGEVHDGIRRAMSIGSNGFDEALKLGTGWRVSAQDTVPFCLWVAAHHLERYEDALWTTAAGEGDRDTTCAIVGGIVTLSAGMVPEDWVERRERLWDDLGD